LPESYFFADIKWFFPQAFDPMLYAIEFKNAVTMSLKAAITVERRTGNKDKRILRGVGPLFFDVYPVVHSVLFALTR